MKRPVSLSRPRCGTRLTGRFQVVGEPIDYRDGVMSSTLLPDGHVLIVGGYTGSLTRNDAWDGPLGTAELWDPATGMFSRAGKMHHIRVGHQAALLGDGRVLVVGGTGAATKDFVNVGLRSTELWDPTTMTFSAGPAMIDGRRGFTLTTLADGSLLAIGGSARNDRGEDTKVRDTAESWGHRPADPWAILRPWRRATDRCPRSRTTRTGTSSTAARTSTARCTVTGSSSGPTDR